MAVCLSGSTCGPTSGVKAGGPSRGMKEGPESEGALRRATPINPSAGGSEKSLSAAATGLGGIGAGSGSQNSPTTITAHVQSTGAHGQYSPAALFASQHHQAVAAGLFGASMGLGPAGLPLPALMASLQAAAAGVLPMSLRPNSNLSSLLSGHGGQNLSYPFPMSQQEALLTWSKLAQSSAAHARNMASSPVSAGNLNLNNLAQHHHHASQHSPSSKAFLDLPGPLGTQKDEKERSINRSDGVGGGKPVTTRVRKSNKASIGNRKESGSIEREKMDLVVEGKGTRERRNSSGVLELITHEAPSPTDTASPPSNGSSCGKSAESSGRKTRAGGDPSRDKVFSCSICHRTFGYKHVLQNHERTHTGEKPFECKQCGKRFTRDHHLKTHMRLHTGEKPYNCTHCDRQFVQVANLRRHLRVHTGERPYACELCTSRFSDSNQLKAHMLIHKGEKPFGCERCSGRFRRRHHLMHHKCPKEDCDTLSTNSSTTLGRRKRNNVALLSSEKAGDLMDADDDPPQTPSSYSLEDELMDLHDEDLEESEEFQRYGVRSSRNSRTTTGEYGTTPSLVISALDMIPQRPTEATSVRLLAEIHTQQQQKRGRKPRETRRVIRIPGHPSSTVVTPPDHHPHHLGSFPLSSHTEQTEPEDLSTMTRPCLPRNLGSLGMKPPLSVRSRQTDDEDGDSEDA